jgi:hypothetical protein
MNDDIKKTISMLSTINNNIHIMNKNIHDMNKNINSINLNTNNMDCNINKINTKINNNEIEEIMNRLYKIEIFLENISTRLENTDTRLDKVEKTLSIVNTSTKNMDQHINFVENIYTVVKKPFTSILGLYYNKNMDNSLDTFDVRKRIVSSKETIFDENDYDLVSSPKLSLKENEE